MMRRWRTWLIVVAVVSALAVAIIVALPVGVRVLAERRAEALTGREVTIGDVDLNLFTRRLAATDVRVHGAEGGPAPLTLQRLDTRFHLLPLLRGRVRLERLALAGIDLYLQRTEPERFNVSDVLAHLAARPATEPLTAVVETLVVTGGRVRLDDRAVDPDRSWTLGDVMLEAHDIVTVADAARGRVSATFLLAGAPGVLEVQRLGVRPPQGRLTLRIDGLNLAGLGAYFRGETPVRFAGGQLTTRLTIDYDAAGAVRADGEASVRELIFTRRGQDLPLLTVPAVTVTARDLEYDAGNLGSGRLDVVADRLTVFDATAPRPRPLDVTTLRATWQARTAAPGDVTVGADLPHSGRLEAAGRADLLTLAADIHVDVKALDVALSQLWIPADAELVPVAGRLAAGLDLGYTEADGLIAGGEVLVEGLEVTRAGQHPPYLRDERIVARVRDLTVRDGVLALGRVEVAGSPTLIDAGVAPAQRLHLPRLALLAEDVVIPGDRPAHVRVESTLPRGGHLEVDGTAGLAPASLSLAVRAQGADLTLAAPYLPPRSPIALGRGHLDATLSVAWDGALRVGGRLVARDLTLLRRSQSEPFIRHPSLVSTITGLVVRDGQLSIERLSFEGAPTIVDANVSPPQRFDVQAATLAVADFTWPGRRPALVEGRATIADGGHSELSGTIHPATLATEVRARFEDVDVTRGSGYLPPTVPLILDHGRAEATVTLRHGRADGVRLDVEGAVHDAELRFEVGAGLRLRDKRIEFTVDDLVVQDGAVSLDAAIVDGAPAFARGGEAAPALSRLHAELRGLRWPSGADASWRVVAEPPEGGHVTARGTFAPATRTVAATVEADDAAIAPFDALLPIDAPVDGRLDARLTAKAGAGRPLALEGDVTLRQVRIGPADTAPIRIASVTATDLTLRGRDLAAARVALERPRVLVEREKDGSFPLRAMLTPAPPPSASPRESPPRERRAADSEPDPALRVTVDEFAVREGNVRFIDQTTTPFYSEELSGLAVTVRGLTNADDRRSEVAIQSIVGVNGALDLQGEVAPFATPFFLDVSGELRDFSVLRTNPYLQRFLDWTARRGELATRVHYRIEGDQLTATNEIVVQRFDVERGRGEDRSERLVGLPLGLVVALLKDARGEIRITVSVSGALGSPQFSFGEAFRTALKNVIGRLITAPFRVIGSVFQREGTVEDVAIEPVKFPPGSAVLTPDAAAHLQRVADFLRGRPYIRLTLEAVISDDDLRVLRAQAVTTRIQRLQREEGLDDFAEAARRLWRARGQQPVPQDPQTIVRELAERQPVPAEAARRLAEHRLGVTRSYLVDAAGIQRDRLLDAESAPSVGAIAGGRVEFELRPAS